MYASKIWRRTNRLSIVLNEAVSTVVLLSFAPTAIERDRCVGVKCSESFWQPVQRTTHEAHVIGMVEIGCEGGRRGKDFEILSQDFAGTYFFSQVTSPVVLGRKLKVDAIHLTFTGFILNAEVG